MIYTILFLIFFILPILGMILTSIFKNHQERMISGIANSLYFLQLIASFAFLIQLILNSCTPFVETLHTIFESSHFDFRWDVYFDKLAAVYIVVANILMYLVAIFSKYYMHRESGFKRFFLQMHLFSLGINAVILAGNFETLFFGWEIVGIASFLLISFYRERYLPVKNAMKVMSFIRMGDVALIIGMWMAHHLFHSNIRFDMLHDLSHFDLHDTGFLIMMILFFITALIKSAQFPFSSWLPRAMEGPTVSSAIFYGSLSVHLGLFLLIRTAPIWSEISTIKWMIIAFGIITSVVATLIARVQPTAKTQIAYSSITQIGIMFVEIGLGWYDLALVHFALNAFLRTYQLLISPSVMSYLVHHQFYHYVPKVNQWQSKLPIAWQQKIFVLSIREFDLDSFWYKYVWNSFKNLGRAFHFLKGRGGMAAIFVMAILSIGLINTNFEDAYSYPISCFYIFVSFILILLSWTERESAFTAWTCITVSQFFFLMTISEMVGVNMTHLVLFISGLIGANLTGYFCLYKVNSIENNVSLNLFHGHIFEHPKYALLFLICSLTMVGFPISPSFLGFDLMFSSIETHHYFVLVMSAFVFIFNEISIIRIYSRIFTGPHVKNYHEIAFRDS